MRQTVSDPPNTENHWIEVLPNPKWVRVQFAGQVIADSRRVLLLREKGAMPVYYFPKEDVHMDILLPSDNTFTSPDKGKAHLWSVRVGDKLAEHAVWSYPDPSPNASSLKGYIAFEWDRMDAWFEEDEEVYVHPRDPYKRIDVMQSSRHVRVVVAGETVAETQRPVLLFETGLPTRYYIPKVDVRMDLLVPSDTQTRCPYKGVAGYHSVAVGDDVATDIAWYYNFPTPETAKIAGLVCFFNERVDALYADGQLLPRPVTKWSR